MPEKKPSNMAADLQRRLKATKSTQLEIAAATGVAQSIISATLNGRMPRLDNYEALLSYVQAHEAKAKRKAGRK